MKEDKKIDFVIPWVDGSDPAWLEEKNKYSKNQASSKAYNFRDYGLMKYLFRGFEIFTPWVNKIHFITWGHLPDFLNTKNPKLNIVNHKDYIPSKYLPTFSANTIDVNFHRIKDISEKFILFNDDMFILKNIPIEYFFEENQPCINDRQIPMIPVSTDVWNHIYLNDIGIINKNFKKEKINFLKVVNHLKNKELKYLRSVIINYLYPNGFLGFENEHGPYPLLKSTCETVWNKEFNILNETSMNKFRNEKNVNSWLMLFWQIASGEYIYKPRSNEYYSLNSNIEELCSTIEKQKYNTICINDSVNSDKDDYKIERIKESLEKILPNKSEFEI